MLRRGFEPRSLPYGNSAVEERRQTLNKTREKTKMAASNPDYNPYDNKKGMPEPHESPQTDTDQLITSIDGNIVRIKTEILDI